MVELLIEMVTMIFVSMPTFFTILVYRKICVLNNCISGSTGLYLGQGLSPTK